MFKKIFVIVSILAVAVAAPVQAQSLKTVSSQLKKLTTRIARLETKATVAGPQGPQGVQGNQGPQGVQGPKGDSAFDAIPSGKTVYGTIGDIQTGYYFHTTTSLPGIAPEALKSAKIIIKANSSLIASCGSTNCLSAVEQANQEFCRGTAVNPLPEKGYLCIYPTGMYTAGPIQDHSFEGIEIQTENNQGSKFGFSVVFATEYSLLNLFQAVWAYQAP